MNRRTDIRCTFCDRVIGGRDTPNFCEARALIPGERFPHESNVTPQIDLPRLSRSTAAGFRRKR